MGPRVVKTKELFRAGILRPFRLRFADGGMLLSLKIQSSLVGKPAVLRIKHDGKVLLDGQVVGSSYGSRNVGMLMEEKDREKREITIVADSTISGRKVESFIEGLNTENIAFINSIQDCAMVFTKDYNLLHLLQRSGVPVIKISPDLDFTDEELRSANEFFKDHPSLQKDLSDSTLFTADQRTALLKMLKKNMLNGMFNFWESMDRQQKAILIQELSEVDHELLSRLFTVHAPYIRSQGKDKYSNAAQLQGKLGLPNLDEITDLTKTDDAKRREFNKRGDTHLRAGKVAVYVLAAGAAQRFGKGAKALVSFDGERKLIEEAARDVFKAQHNYNSKLTFYYLVSPMYGQAIIEFMTENKFFGLDPDWTEPLWQRGKLAKGYWSPAGWLSLALSMSKHHIDTAPTGHAAAIAAFQEQGIQTFEERGHEDLFLRTIDNTGATVRDESYREVLGCHLASGKDVTVELVHPKIGTSPTGEKILLDRGGGAFSLDGVNALIELLAVPKELQQAAMGYPFNTLSLTLRDRALRGADLSKFPWYVTDKPLKGADSNWKRYQFEQLVGDITHQFPPNFVIVDREGQKGRFNPLKELLEMQECLRVFREMEAAKDRG